MIEIKNLTKKYGDFTALENVNITVDDCSVLGIAGYNGAGKTTLLRVCAGVFKADVGGVYLDGADAFDNDCERKRSFFLPDNMCFPRSATIKTAAKYYAVYYPDFDFEIYKKICTLFGLTDEKKKIRSLSKGMIRQVSLATAFATKPKYLFIDETFDGLDPQKKIILKKLMLEYINETNASVIICSHDLSQIAEVCDHIVLINGKTVKLSCPIEEISSSFRFVNVQFEKTVTKEIFENINHKNIRITGKTASLLIYGDLKAEKEKIKNLGGTVTEEKLLTLEEVFCAETDSGEENGIFDIFKAKNEL